MSFDTDQCKGLLKSPSGMPVDKSTMNANALLTDGTDTWFQKLFVNQSKQASMPLSHADIRLEL